MESEILERVKNVTAKINGYDNYQSALYHEDSLTDEIAIAYHKERNRIIAPTEEEVILHAVESIDTQTSIVLAWQAYKKAYGSCSKWMRKHFTE
jgi:hypothetical protein